MTFTEALGATFQPRSSTAQAFASKLHTAHAAPAAQPQTAQAVAQPSAMESTRLMMESRSNAGQNHVPTQGRSTLTTGSMTAAYLTEMRLTQELEAIQEKLSK